MTASDISDQTKGWKNTKRVADLIYKEFFKQGDLEKALGREPTEMMDRERACIPDLQIGFLDAIVIPLFQMIAKLFSHSVQIKEIFESIEHNRDNWTQISAMVQSGSLHGNDADILHAKLVQDDQ